MECEFNSFFWGHSSGKICDTSVDKTFTVTIPNRVITSINGESVESFSKKRRIRRLLVEHKTVKFIPKGLGEAFPLLQGIRIYNASLTSISRDDLQPFINLLELNLARNQLESLQSDLFVSNQKLQAINLEHNKLKFIGEFLLHPLMELVEATFRGNDCIDENEISAVKASIKRKCKFSAALSENDLRSFLSSREKEFQLKVKLLEVENAALKSDNKTFLDSKKKEVKKSENVDDYDDDLFCGKDCDNYEELYSDEDDEPKIDLFEKCSSLVKLKVEVSKSCNKIEDKSEEILNNEKLQEKSKALEAQVKENSKLKEKLSEVETEMKLCDGSFDAATRNWYVTSSQLKSCRNPQTIIDIDSPAPEKIDFICQADDNDDLYYENVVCKVIDLKVEFSNSSIVQVKDVNEESVNDEIKRLSITNQQALFLPRNIADHFPKLTELVVSTSGLIQLESKVFEKLTTLSDLIITGNKVRKIPCQVFVTLKDLLNLDLSKNRIEKIDDEDFKGLSKLKTLKLNNNLLVTLNDKWFRDVKNLINLELQSNQLKFIDIKFLTSLSHLSAVDLTKNKCIDAAFPKRTLAQIESVIADKCVAPIELNCDFAEDKVHLNENTLVNGYMCSLHELHELEILYPNAKIAKVNGDHSEYYDKNNVTLLVVMDQSVKFLPINLADFLPKLETIIIEHSNLTAIEKQNFRGFDELRWISIRHNNLSFIGDEVFDFVQLVTYIDLAFNNIESLPSRIFSKLTKLMTLTLSSNNIKRLNADLFSFKNVIQEFRVDNNQLEFIDSKILRPLRRSSIIDFSLNECIDMRFVKSVKSGASFPELYTEVGISCSDG